MRPTFAPAGVRLLVGLTLLAVAASAGAQVSADDRSCIAAFNKNVREIGKAQGKIVTKCLQRFASGSLATGPEACLVTDVSGQLARKTTSAATKTVSACEEGLPAFAVSPIETALARAAVGEIDLVHAAIGPDLDRDLVSAAAVATCQTKVTTALAKCADARWQVFLKCQKTSLAAGFVTNAATLVSRCLPNSDVSPFDPGGKVAKLCAGKVAATVAQRCGTVDLRAAFPWFAGGTPAQVGEALVGRSRCQMCRVVNDVDTLALDCDRFDDGADNGTCGAECADGVVQTAEACDDGNTANGDGCSAACGVEAGWACAGSPSSCAPSCGNGVVDAGEGCDDGDRTGGDGCSATCQAESGFACSGAPSTCTSTCGNGVVQTGQGEACDDGDHTGGDGCSAACAVEPGFLCAGQPSVCTFVCGNGMFDAGETCDDRDTQSGDGCSSACRIEPGWACTGRPSLCTPVCGDGRVRGGEGCDDGATAGGDGCAFACQPEAGFACAGEPSNCIAICGDGFIRGLETCDDHNGASGDGCSGTFCRREPGYTCTGQPSVCIVSCGNAQLDGQEDCDDGNRIPGDGCNPACRIEAGHACVGTPSVCVRSCGNGAFDPGETCDDGNAAPGDGCSASCRNESGWYCAGPGAPCQPFEVVIDTPLHGSFTTAGTALVTGRYSVLPPGVAAVSVNGAPASTLNPFTRTFAHTVPLNAASVFNPVRVTLADTGTGDAVSDRVVVIAGPSVADGAFSPESVALRMNDLGLDTIEPLVGEMAAGQFDLATLLPPDTEILPWQCYFQFIWCWAGASARIGSPAPSFGAVHFAADSKPNAVAANISLDNLRIDIHIDGTGIVPDCGLRLTANKLVLAGDYALSPDVATPAKVNVDLANLTSIGFEGFQHQFTYGSCGLVSSQLGDVQQLARDAISGFLGDPDGAGPQDSPLADAIEDTLGGISIAGAVGAGLGLQLEAPLFDVAEDASGIALGGDARFTTSIGSGPGQCVPPPDAPDLAGSYAPPEPFPAFGPTTPVGGQPYGLGVSISSAGFNQLLRGQTECGLMRSTLTTIDLDGAGGAPPQPITAGLLALLASELSQLPPATPLVTEITPTLAPLVTGQPGPGGELTELRVAQVLVEIVQPGVGVWLGGVLDARLGMTLDFLADGSGLGIVLSAPSAADTTFVLLENPLGANAAQVESIMAAVIRPMIPDLAGSLGFPLPEFFGLQVQGVEVSRNGQFMTLFANLAPAP